ncbi:MAG: hypothetical protein ACR2PA_27040, partial [Hyphomicrobiaceae bacterium]
FRPERLLVHEVLIRVTADLAVYAGRNYEDLGINFRRMAAAILDETILLHRNEFQSLFEETRAAVSDWIKHELDATLFAVAVTEPARKAPSVLARLFGRQTVSEPSHPIPRSDNEGLAATLTDWLDRSVASQNELESACVKALHRVAGGVAGRHGRIVGDRELITSIAATLVMNEYGSAVLGQALEPYFQDAISEQGFRRLPVQAKPVVMNTKGASASGKSTMRPYQHSLAERIGVPWDDFALISPDIWRKYLLDYEGLGAAFKYAGMMTGHEIDAIDRKLDRYMARKAAAGNMSHLLIDRFRFDSFVPESDADEPVRLLTRFGDLVYMFFMITPPEETIVRAWRRGQMVGRYKAVDDLLAHNIEAYSGMPELFFTWTLRTDKRVHCEFLDNTVPLGSRPRTVAYGWNGELNILDVKAMIDVDRFRKVNVRATRPEDVYPPDEVIAARNTDFLQKCAKLLPVINFADQRTGRIFARMEGGTWTWCDPAALADAVRDKDVAEGMAALGLPRNGRDWTSDHIPAMQRLDADDAHTIGNWGPSAQVPVAGSFAG